ncbi:unnamed protein product [Nippostrongylus brasiliensis]|uniref:Uncharacterized protein n=1 Tax=Nippostrongylus brasiliensis TaxID=27835 RepID=A0A0N4YQ92_NIPBR|nr:unnamed protein product [Nippostrongylus brasiliensis]
MGALCSSDPQQDRRKSAVDSQFSKSNQEYVFIVETPRENAANTSGEECRARMHTDELPGEKPIDLDRVLIQVNGLLTWP